MDNATDDDRVEYGRVKVRLAAMQRAKCRGAALRAETADWQYGDSYSPYFMGLEKQTQRQKITKFKYENGTETKLKLK